MLVGYIQPNTSETQIILPILFVFIKLRYIWGPIQSLCKKKVSEPNGLVDRISAVIVTSAKCLAYILTQHNPKNVHCNIDFTVHVSYSVFVTRFRHRIQWSRMPIIYLIFYLLPKISPTSVTPHILWVPVTLYTK